LIPNPILKVLSTLTSNQVRYLLMGGQACVLYGAAEFSRDTDIAVLAEPGNLERLTAALDELQARCIAVPSFRREYLLRGHAVHFRSGHAEAANLRIDVMSVLRGVAPFEELWPRRTTLEFDAGLRIEVMALPDLVLAKKTQRDKDWPMIRRLLEAHYACFREEATPEQVRFWLRESRTPAMLIELAKHYPEAIAALTSLRPLLTQAAAGDEMGLTQALAAEEGQQRKLDRAYWLPLKAELEALRHPRK